MKQITELEELKKIQLDILIKVHEFCQKNNLRYSLDSGTLLGAIRHKGYIPWDDDIDIIMPRPDYLRFLESFNGFTPELKVLAPELDWNFYAPYANVYDTRTILNEGANSHRGIELGIKIDIFPVDGAPSDEDEYIKLLKVINRLNLQMQAKRYIISDSGKSLKLKAYLLYHRVRSVFKSYSQLQKQISFLCSKNSFDNSPFAAKLSYTWTKNRCPRKVFEEFIDCEFEGQRLKIIKEYDLFLKKMYGNYMQLPPEGKRVPHHGFKAYWKD